MHFPSRPLLLAAASAAMLTAPAVAHAGSPIRVEGGWVAASLAGQRTGAAYLTLTNTGRAPDRLLGGTSPAAATVAPHHMATDRGVMIMRKLDGVALPPGGRVVFKPGGDHLMLEGLKRPLKAGQTVALTLRFARTAALTVRLPVRPAMSGMAGMSIGR